jgi:hypothetical protein
MCAGYDAVYTWVDYSHQIINSYYVGYIQNYVQNAVNANGNADVPERVYDANIDPAERALMECIIQSRGNALRPAFDWIHAKGRKLKVKGGPAIAGNPPTENMAIYTQNADANIEINRTLNAEAALDLKSNDTVEQERKVYLKVFAESYIHEVCHAYYNDFDITHGGSESVYSQVFYETQFGECVLDGFFEVFGETPPHWRYVQNPNNPNISYSLPGCLSTIYSNNQNYLKSVRSGVAAKLSAPPSWPLLWNYGPNPH